MVNVLLFVPLTFLTMGALTCDRSRTIRLIAAPVLVPASACLAASIEFAQTWFANRTVSLNDIVAETIGGAIGAACWIFVGQRTITWMRRFSADRRPRSRLTWLLKAYAIGFFVYSVMPLDLTLSLAELYQKYRQGHVSLIPFSHAYGSVAAAVYQSFGDIAQFVPIGMWVAYTQRNRVSGYSIVLVGAIGGGLVAAAVEIAQLFVVSRYTDATDIVLGALGSAIGGWIVGRLDRDMAAPVEPATRVHAAITWLSVVAAYSLFLVLGFLYPFAITHDRALIVTRAHTFFKVPFLVLYVSVPFNALTQMLVRILLYAPLGMMWARLSQIAVSSSVRRTIGALGIAYAAVLALGIEIVQILMPSKVADPTEVALCALGALGGLIIVWRLTPEPPHPEPPSARARQRQEA
jgi:glycopeptide antibiotics resistance protein